MLAARLSGQRPRKVRYAVLTAPGSPTRAIATIAARYDASVAVAGMRSGGTATIAQYLLSFQVYSRIANGIVSRRFSPERSTSSPSAWS